MLAAPSVLRRCLLGIVGVVTTLSSLVLIGGLTSVPTASAAATAPAATQCDPPAFPTGAGFEVNCTITIANTVTSSGAVSSTVTATACLAAAGVLPPFGCTTTVTTSNQLVTSVDQCNGIVVGGGSNVICDVSVVNTIPTGKATSGVTVNQCVGTGTGGGTQPTVECAPVASTTGATVTQCNGSGNGGGASIRVQCDVTGAATAEPVTINQCNGSSNGGGSTVTCMATFTNNFVAALPTTTTTIPTTPTTVPTPTVPGPSPTSGAATGAGTGSPVGSGVTGTTGSAGGAGGSTGTSAVTGTLGVIPFGSPQTGLGGASRSSDGDLLIPGVVAIIGAALAMAFAIRRRRSLPVRGSDESS
jgi:hypothetical protein